MRKHPRQARPSTSPEARSLDLRRPGGSSEAPPPDPIPNSAVKRLSAQGTVPQGTGEQVAAGPAKINTTHTVPHHDPRLANAAPHGAAFCVDGPGHGSRVKSRWNSSRALRSTCSCWRGSRSIPGRATGPWPPDRSLSDSVAVVQRQPHQAQHRVVDPVAVHCPFRPRTLLCPHPGGAAARRLAIRPESADLKEPARQDP